MLSFNIKEQLNDPGRSPESRGLLEEFQRVSGLERYIWDDAEGYWEAQCYADLLVGIRELTLPDFLIENVESADEDGNWTFSFEVNEEPVSFSMPNTGTDWFDSVFLQKLDAAFAPFGSDKKLRIVYTTGIQNMDQCFDLCFISDAVYEKLVAHPVQFAGPWREM